MLLVITLIVAIGSALAAASVASSKDCNGIAWLIAGFLLGPIGVIAAAGRARSKAPQNHAAYR